MKIDFCQTCYQVQIIHYHVVQLPSYSANCFQLLFIISFPISDFPFCAYDEFQGCLILKCIRGLKLDQALMVLIILEVLGWKPNHYLSHAMATRCKMEAVQQSTSLEVHISQSLGPNVHFILICNNNNNIRETKLPKY